jgi:hypothetical protein
MLIGDFKKIFAEKFGKKIVVFDSKQQHGTAMLLNKDKLC